MSETDSGRHLGLLADTGRIASLMAGSSDIQTFLDRCVERVAEHLDAEVCSVYLFEEDRSKLVLRATKGLNADMIGALSLDPGEGLVGKAFLDRAPLHTDEASAREEYRFVPGSGEERFDTFLAVPIVRGNVKVGVLVVQRLGNRSFHEDDIVAMQVLSAQLAAVVENARALLSFSRPRAAPPVPSAPGLTRGEAVSPGCATGEAFIMKRTPAAGILRKWFNGEHDEVEEGDFDLAVRQTMKEIGEEQKCLGRKLPEAASLIFESHLMMLKDVGFSGKIKERIADGLPPSRAVAETAIEYIKLFEASEHAFMREKARDVEDLALRLLDNLGPRRHNGRPMAHAHVVIARELLPSDILRIAQGNVQGIVLVSGGSTAHVSLLLRSLKIPMVIAGSSDLLRVRNGERIIVDGFTGNIFVNPSEKVEASYRGRHTLEAAVSKKSGVMKSSTRTLDGQPVHLMANINLLSELELAEAMKAEGVGLYRTEFPFLMRQDLPTEVDQENIYRKLLERMPDKPVVFRTLDAGGDKVLSYYDSAGETNPALGLRSTRFSLKYPDIFDQQLRAILRASRLRRDVGIMFPMISSLEEFRKARARLELCAEAVSREDGEFHRPAIGMMVEVPAVVALVDDFAAEADFFSIGTNDFIQYMLAVDRTNDRVAEYYCPHHPSVLRGIDRVVTAAHNHGIEVSVCGEMAHDPRYVPFFLGIGIRTLSVEPNYLPTLQTTVRRISLADAKQIAREMLARNTIRGVESCFRDASA